MITVIKKIIYFVILTGTLFSCQKDGIEVLKNTDTSWKVDESIVNADIRKRLGYDPRKNYAILEKSSLNISIEHIGELSFDRDKNVEMQVILSNGVSKKDVNISLEYNPSLFKAIESKYPDYILGDKDLVSFPEDKMTIKAGEKSGVLKFSIKGLTKVKNQIIPFSFKIEGNDEIHHITEESKVFSIIMTQRKEDYLVSKSWVLNPFKECSDIFKTTFEQIKKINKEKSPDDEITDNLIFGLTSKRKIGIEVPIKYYGYDYSQVYIYDFKINEKNQLELKNGRPNTSSIWNVYYSHFNNLIELLKENEPYNIEKMSSTKAKLVSANNPDVWFTINLK